MCDHLPVVGVALVGIESGIAEEAAEMAEASQGVEVIEGSIGGWFGVGAIPPILAVSDCIMGLASGMTVKFFPIFFWREVGLGPTAVNLIMCCGPLSMSLCSFLGQRFSLVIGTIPYGGSWSCCLMLL